MSAIGDITHVIPVVLSLQEKLAGDLPGVEAWCGDITYQGWNYLAVVMDL